MKYALTWAALSAALAWAATPSISPTTLGPSENIVPLAYVIEFDPLIVGISSLTGKRSATPHIGFYEAMHKRDITWSTTFEYIGDLFNGVSVRLSKEDDLLKLAEIAGILSIYPVVIHPAPSPASHHVLTGSDDPNIPPDTQSTHIMTGVDKLHAEGKFGEGVKIGIIDSGFDYKHPSLGGCFGPGCKFASGHDFVGDDYTGGNQAIPDNDPMDCGGHGTHVAGIIGADPGNMYNISGVAYKAELAGYRVFGCSGGVGNDVLIAAFERAYNENCDVITASLGGTAGWSTSATSVVASRLAEKGRIVTIAAGNEGEMGMWFAATPATGVNVIAVGSVDNTMIPIQYAKVSGHDDIVYYSLTPLPFTETLPVYPTSKTIVANDACDPLPADTPDLSGYVVLMRRGGCAFTDKLAIVAAKGARVALIYNDGRDPTGFDADPIPAALISAEDGAYLLNQYLAGSPPTISFPQTGGNGEIPNPSGGLISSFSTFGPTYDAYMKPSIAAPGGGIISTYPQSKGSWAIESGTSMATPYVAGVAALLLEAKGKARDVYYAARDLLQTTAKVVPSSRNESALLQTAAVQGAGLINAYNLVHYETTVSPGQLLLNDTANFNGQHTIKITNRSNKEQKYTLCHKPAGTAQSLRPGSIQQNVYPVPLTDDAASVHLPQSVTVKAGETKSFDVTITAPNADTSVIPVYSGYIEIAAECGEIFSVTYMGIASSLRDAAIFDNTNELFGYKLPALLDAQGKAQTTEQKYTFSGNDRPSILYRFVMGTRAFTIDLVSEDTTVQDTLARRDVQEKRGLLDSLMSWLTNGMTNSINQNEGTYSQVPILGSLLKSQYRSRHDPTQDAGFGYSTFVLRNNTFSDSRPIPNGRYKFLLRALKITGDLTNESDYEAWLSPVVVFNATNA
ncbi:subtilisin-like protein [Serendipita vermifera]|nr:subtilisin-like protein [Serendipita vermifera]